MIQPSNEQMEVINAIKDGYNVQVDAVAGSGKTTTILSLAHINSDKKIIQVTYNSDLKTEVRDKKKKYSECMKLDNLEIHTYHSIGVTYYIDDAKTDIGLNIILEQNLPPTKPLPIIDVMVIDEIQDMNELYYRFILKVLKDIGGNIQILTLGDKYQGLYDFKGADTRYLTLSSYLWKISDYPFKILKLTTSYRITHQIASFINKGMLNENRLKAVKNGPPVYYIRHPEPYQVYKIIGRRLIDMIESGYAKPEDIFILSPSVKGDKIPCVKLIENMLVSNNIPCYVPMTETSSINREIIKKKVIFSSFHQSKGRERKIVVVLGFDESYFKFFNKTDDTDDCPSTMYVATTRATDTLIIVECSNIIPFLKYTHQEMVQLPPSNFEFIGDPLNFISEKQILKSSNTPTENYYKTSPTQLIKFLDENVLIKIVKLMKEIFITDELSYPLQNVKLNKVVNNQIYFDNELSEEVYDINGLVIPAIFEERNSNENSSIKDFVRAQLLKTRSNYVYKKLLKNIDFKKTSIEDYLKIVNVYISMKENLYFKIAQINNYDWLTENDVDELMINMSRHIHEKDHVNMIYEYPIIEYSDIENHKKIDEFVKNMEINKIRFTGIVDAINEDIVWEFKCVDALEPEHLLQLVIYSWIWKMSCEDEYGERIFKIMNIRTSEVQIIQYNSEIIDQIMTDIFKAKFEKRKILTDDEFIQYHNV